LGQALAVAGVLTAGLTAFYSFRLVFVTFWGTSRVDPHHAAHVHEPSPTMTVPLMVLALLSIITGYLGIPGFLAPVFSSGSEAGLHHEGSAGFIMAGATLAGLLGISAAYYIYVANPSLPDRFAQQWRSLYELSLHKWYFDELYDRSFVRPTFSLAQGLWKHIDVNVIDAAVNGTARAVAWGAWFLRLAQSGQIQHYALGMALGTVVILTVFIFF
jgi:NADH-quinone oxidoreductase subunit L